MRKSSSSETKTTIWYLRFTVFCFKYQVFFSWENEKNNFQFDQVGIEIETKNKKQIHTHTVFLFLF